MNWRARQSVGRPVRATRLLPAPLRPARYSSGDFSRDSSGNLAVRCAAHPWLCRPRPAGEISTPALCVLGAGASSLPPAALSGVGAAHARLRGRAALGAPLCARRSERRAAGRRANEQFQASRQDRQSDSASQRAN